jgi:hypothetical protein
MLMFWTVGVLVKPGDSLIEALFSQLSVVAALAEALVAPSATTTSRADDRMNLRTTNSLCWLFINWAQ